MQHMSNDKQHQFDYMSPIGFIPALKNHRKEKLDQFGYTDFFMKFSGLNPSVEKLLREKCAHKLVGYSEERQRMQEKKFDCLPVDPNDDIADLAQEYTYRMYKAALQGALTVRPTVCGEKGPAFPYTTHGFATKAAAMESELHQTLMQDKPDPIWVGTPKGGEALPQSDLDDGKLRTFSQVALYFASYQKFLFEDQNVRMKSFHRKTWGKYGWVKQYGGIHELWSELEHFLTRVMLDVSGWDRKVWLKRVYELRRRGLEENLGDAFKVVEELFDWVTRNTVEPVTSFVDGSIFRRKTGNCSGSNNTTTDNTLAHSIVLFYFFIWRWKRVYCTLPTYEQVVESVRAALFGDDSAFSLDAQLYGYNSPEELRLDLMEVYGKFGLTIKPHACHIDWENPGPVEGIEFLGTTGVWDEHHHRYVGKGRLSKLTYSLMCHNDNGSLLSEVNKAIAIWDLVASTEPELRQGIREYVQFLYEEARNVNFDGLSSTDVAEMERVLRDRFNFSLWYGMEGVSFF